MRFVTNSHRSMSPRVPRLGYATGGLSVSVADIENSQRFQCLMSGLRRRYGGEGGIRTHDTVPRMLAFEASTFNHSVTSPQWLALF